MQQVISRAELKRALASLEVQNNFEEEFGIA